MYVDIRVNIIVIIIIFCFAGSFIGIPHALNGSLVNVQPALEVLLLRIDRSQLALERIFRLQQLEISIAKSSFQGTHAAIRKVLGGVTDDGNIVSLFPSPHPLNAPFSDMLAVQVDRVKTNLLLAGGSQCCFGFLHLLLDIENSAHEDFRLAD